MTIIYKIPLVLGLILALSMPAQADIDLTELSLEDLRQVKVTSASKYEQKQTEVAAAVSVITRDEIKAFGWRTLDQAMASLPGIYTTYDRQYTYLGTRGFGLPGDLNTRVLLAIDGNRVNDVVFDFAKFGIGFPLDMDLVERIEFIAGPGGAIYGQNAMFGVINVITRNGAQVNGGELTASWKSPQTMGEGRISGGMVLSNGVDVLLSASGMHARGEDLFIDFPGAGPLGSDISGVADGQDGARDKEFFARVGRGPWSIDFIYGKMRKDDPTASYASDALSDGQYEGDAYTLTQLHYQDNLGDKLNVLGRLFLGLERYAALYNYSGAPTYFTGSSDWLGAELRLLYTGLADHNLLLGLENQNNTRVDQTTDDLTTPYVDTEILLSGHRTGIYIQDEWRFIDNWSATLGLRVDDNKITGTQLSPRVGLIWQTSPKTTIKTLYGRAHRAPNAFERDNADGLTQIANPDLKGETIDTLELTMDYQLARDFNMRGSIYHWNMLDIVTQVEISPGLNQYQSGDKVKANGLELSADKTWVSHSRLRCSLAYQEANFVNGGELLNSPHWLGKLNYSRPLPWAGLLMGFELQYNAKRLTKDGSYLDDYWLSNLNLIAGQWVKGMEMSLGVLNLFDQHYQHPGSKINYQNALEQDGRSIWARLDYHF